MGSSQSVEPQNRDPHLPSHLPFPPQQGSFLIATSPPTIKPWITGPSCLQVLHLPSSPSSLFLPLRAYLKEASRSFQPKPESSGSVLGQDSGGHDTDITAPTSAESRAETAAARASPLLWELGNSVSETQLLSSPGSLLLTPAPRRSASRPAGRRPT